MKNSRIAHSREILIFLNLNSVRNIPTKLFKVINYSFKKRKIKWHIQQVNLV